MARYEVILPAMGEGIIEASITRWLVSDGQHVSIDQPLVEVATDKVDSEIPSPVEGTFIRRVYREGDIPRVGEVIALIETPQPVPTDIQQSRTVESPHAMQVQEQGGSPEPEKRRKKSFEGYTEVQSLSPLIRMLAKQRGITQEELRHVEATGLNGRITRDDLNKYIMTGRRILQGDLPDNATKEGIEADPPAQEYQLDPGDEVVEMGRLRKLIASHMVRSKRTAPHVTSFLEADITAMVAWRDSHKDEFYRKEQAKLTFTPLVIEAVARALKEFPRINISVSGDSIIMRKNINIGFATALPDGNLIVPVIRNADYDNLGTLARKVSDLADRARNNALLPAEIKGGTFTITNIGQYNNLTGTPIINQPEAAILAVGTIIKKPWAVKTGGGYGMAVRDITMLALSYDHRVIDGALGGSFLSRVAWYLENYTSAMNTTTFRK
jgi:2-oxoglutarate dehydrogenase E2 component (dihydrolipoamide succinyltransferase)